MFERLTEGHVAGNGEYEDPPLVECKRHPDLVVKSTHPTPQSHGQHSVNSAEDGCIIAKSGTVMQVNETRLSLSHFEYNAYE